MGDTSEVDRNLVTIDKESVWNWRRLCLGTFLILTEGLGGMLKTSGAVYSGETRSVPEESSTSSTHREDESPSTEAKSKAYNCLAEGSTSEPRKRDLEHGSECVSPRSGVRETSWECPITMDYVRELWWSLGSSSEGATSPARSSSPVIDPEPDETI